MSDDSLSDQRRVDKVMQTLDGRERVDGRVEATLREATTTTTMDDHQHTES